jgi:translation initiation factor 3 subunit C
VTTRTRRRRSKPPTPTTASRRSGRAGRPRRKAAAGVSGGDDGFEVVGKKGQAEKKELDVMKCPKEKVTYAMVDKKLAEVIASRGKKGTDRHENVDVLAYLAEVSTCAAQEVETLIMLISAQFDISGSMATHMPIPIWKKCVNNLIRIDQVLKENAQISLTESAEPEPKPAPEEIVAGAPVQLWGSLCAFTERLDDEYFKSMQSIDPHAKEYVYRMQDESLFIVLASEMVAYYEKRDAPDVTCKLALRLLEHLYYKPEPVYEALRAFAEKKLRDADALAAKLAADAEAARRAAEERARLEAERAKQAEEEGDEYLDDEDADEAEAKEASEIPYPTGVTFPVETLPKTLDRLALLIFKDGDGRQKARAMLCQIFTAGLTGDFRRGRDLMLMSHLQENISQMDISTQILFNRAMAQLGLSAFRLGMFHEAQACLGELYLGGRVRELLAQGVTQSRFHERSQEQEKLERRRQMPFHMHINLDLLESVHLVCSMLIEVPHMANSARRARSNNKPFARLVDGYERQTFNGPPETAREHVMAATRAMLAGEWRAAADLILGLECWALLPEGSKDRVLGAVTRRLKEEALRTYLFQFAAQYNSVSLDVVAAMFDLDRKSAYGLVSKMIVNEELHGMCDEPSASVVMAHVEPTRLQQLAMTFAEKCAVLLDANERALDLHVGAGGAQLFDYEEELHQDHRRDAAVAAGAAGEAAAARAGSGKTTAAAVAAGGAAAEEAGEAVVAGEATATAATAAGGAGRRATRTSPRDGARRATSRSAAAGSLRRIRRRTNAIPRSGWSPSRLGTGGADLTTSASSRRRLEEYASTLILQKNTRYRYDERYQTKRVDAGRYRDDLSRHLSRRLRRLRLALRGGRRRRHHPVEKPALNLRVALLHVLHHQPAAYVPLEIPARVRGPHVHDPPRDRGVRRGELL